MLSERKRETDRSRQTYVFFDLRAVLHISFPHYDDHVTSRSHQIDHPVYTIYDRPLHVIQNMRHHDNIHALFFAAVFFYGAIYVLFMLKK